MSRPRSTFLIPVLTLLLPLVAIGCVDLFLSPDAESGRLSLSFRLAEADGASAGVAPGPVAASTSVDPAFSTTVTGSTGATLVLHDVRIVVGEFALERDVGDCDASTAEEEGSCARFVADPHLLQLSLGELEAGEEIRVSESAPADVYSALRFAVRVPGDTLLSDIRQQGQAVAEENPDRPKLAFGDWPEEATAFVSGAYDPDGPDGAGEPVPFRIFFHGEAGAQIDFQDDLPLVIRAGETTEAAIVMSREAWRASDGQEVLDLSQLDYDETGQVYALDPALIEGFESVDISS